MSEPLNINQQNIDQNPTKLKSLSSAVLLSTFCLKSPTHIRINLPQSLISSIKDKQTPKGIANSLKKLSFSNKENIKSFSVLPQNKKQNEKLSRKDLQVNIVKRQSAPQEGQFKKNMSKLIKKINVQTLVKQKQQKFKIPLVKLKKANDLRLPAPLSDRTKDNTNCQEKRVYTNHTTKHQTLVHKDIDISNFLMKTNRSQKQKKPFNRESSASTLSLRTKHTSSMINFSQQQQLFTRGPALKSIKTQSNDNVIKTIEQTKQKIYQQIYALDKKLISEPIQSNKKSILIRLKKKINKQEIVPIF